ncbi:hypothetical protein [Rhizohabitans arisaemae]|nr:hypothetical protein [Rhizohabitans arisaemae]
MPSASPERRFDFVEQPVRAGLDVGLVFFPGRGRKDARPRGGSAPATLG